MKNIITKIAAYYHQCNQELYMDELSHHLLDEISTPECKLLWLDIGVNKKSSQFGYLLGGFIYKPTNQIFKFRYCIYDSNHMKVMNQMTSISEIIIKNKPNLHDMFFDCFKEKETMFGISAFWRETLDKDLEDKDAYNLRQLMNQITSYVYKMQYSLKFPELAKTISTDSFNYEDELLENR